MGISDFSRLESMIGQLLDRFPFQSHIAELYSGMTEQEKREFDSCIQFICDVYGMTERDILDCYQIFNDDTLEESKYFIEHGKYRYSTYKEVNEYMLSKDTHYMRSYQIGLLLSLFVWPNHSAMRKYFLQSFHNFKGKLYLEVGVGHGYYFKTAVQSFDYGRFVGIDISDDSLHMVQSFLRWHSMTQPQKYELKKLDFLTMESGAYAFDAIVCGEVLEHVENPGAFIKKCSDLAHEKTLIHITTAINAPAIDHISLFRSPDELANLFCENGLTILEMKLFLYRNKNLEFCLKRKLPITVSILARKAS
ncbi:MAG: class I SAM-dependent methyltransferase [Negativicutes bacterium]|nr:class I SAM-dependent methyltransferase [Negativicutes bacterium]